MQENNPPEIIPVKQSSFLVTLLSVLLLISCLIAGFFAWQTQNLVKELQEVRSQELVTSTPTTTSDPTISWNTYTNTKYLYSLKCPQTSTHKVELENGNGNDKPKYQEICFEGQNQFRISVYNSNTIIDNQQDGVFTHEINLPSNKFKVLFEGFDKKYFDQILSTFKFIEPQANSSPVACTMEAKICPDGSSVGRTGPNCEFSACPSPKN